MAKNKKEKDFEKKILAYALKNAIEHEGKAIANSVLNSLFHEGLEKNQIKNVMPLIQKTIKEINSLTLKEQEKKFLLFEKEISHRKERVGLPELPNVPKTGVIMRFSPSPSGPLHIGHAATGMPSSLYVKKYGGKFYLRIEDTNPENIDPDAYKMIPEEANWLFGNVYEYYFQSDRMEKYYDFSKKLIEKGAAYVCDCDPEQFKKLIEKRKACPCRSLTIKENMERWKKMFTEYKEGQAVLRFKSDLKLENPALRDFPLARIKETEHPRQGKKYRVWPLMNLCVALDDMEYDITHIIRAKEHRDNALRQEMIFKVFNKKAPEAFFLGRLKFTNIEISCTKTKKLIEQGKYSGWDDIRLPFIAALKKRGYQPEAFAKMAEQRGLSEVDKVLKKEDYFAVLDNFNREIIKEKAKKIEFSPTKVPGFKEIVILMPDGKKSKGYVKAKEVKSLKNSDIVYFVNFGYAKLNGKEFWFAHN